MRKLTTLLTILALALAGCMSPEDTGPADDGTTEAPGSGDGSEEEDGSDDTGTDAHALIVQSARAAAEGLRTTEDARAAGYEPTPFCIPGMGVHWVHEPGQADSFIDTTFDPEHPEVLLFLPDDANLSDTANDTFLGVEYMVAVSGPNATAAEVPEWHGVRFDGPMEGHGPGEPWHADFHVYLAEGYESDATFAAMNPAVTCPEGTTPPAPEDEHEHEHDEEEAHGREPVDDATYTSIMNASRAAAEGLRTTEDARAAGYEPTPFCIPGMGVHWVHEPGQEGSFVDSTFDPEHPEVLLFLPDDANLSDTANDTFLAVEYMVVVSGENATEDEVPLWHGVRFDGPMEGHGPGEPWHADFHVYLAEGYESDATFAAMNPAVTCPEGTTPPAE